MDAPPELDDVAALAERAVAHLRDEGQVTALWEDGALTVTATAVADGRCGRAVATGTSDAELARAARAAGLKARQARAWPSAGLPDPAEVAAVSSTPPREVRTPRADPAEVAAVSSTPPREVRTPRPRPDEVDGVGLEWCAREALIAVASTRGVRSVERRSHVVVTATGRREDRSATATATGATAADAPGVAADVLALLGEGASTAFAPQVAPGATTPPPPGPTIVVLGPEAVAAVLEQVRPAAGVLAAFGDGALADRRGRRVAAEIVTLRDCARHPETLPRGYDAEGLPRAEVALIDGGVARDLVHDTASAARAGDGARSTGHATQPGTLAPYPDHLVLAAGEAGSAAALCEPVASGLYVAALAPAFERAGSRRIHQASVAAAITGGEVVGHVGVRLAVDAFAVLAAVEELTAVRRLVPLTGHVPGGIGAALVPALRARAGIEVVA